MNRKILVVEDSDEVRAVVVAILAPHHCAVTQAINGEEAIMCFAREKPDLVILDLGLPRIDGFEVFRHVRSVDTAVPVIIVTGLLDGYVIDVIYEYGWAIFARKPQDINTGFFGAVLRALFGPPAVVAPADPLPS